jgi:four helix bundle protein
VKIDRFEKIEAWQKARELANYIFEITSQKKFAKDYGLRDQIQRASVSVMANIAEGFGSNSNKEFTRFLGYANRSVYEIQSHLYVALDRGYIKQEDFESIYDKAINTTKLTKGFIRYLKSVE